MKRSLIFSKIIIFLCGIVLVAFSPLKGVRKYTLPNGMRYLLKEDHSQPVVSVQVWVRAGSVNENDRINGISHLVEHMVFKGTVQYPAGEISRTVEANGGSINAATSSEYTFYYIDIPSHAFEKALSILSDAMMHCTLPEAELEKERRVILEEIKRKDDRPESEVWDNLRSQLYQKTPYRYRVIGSSAVVSSLTRDELFRFYKTYYRPDNMLLIVVGDFKIKEARKIIKKYFTAAVAEKKPASPDLIEPARETYAVQISSRSVKQTHLSLGFIGPPFHSKDQFPLDVCSVILGRGRSSRLYRHIREEKKLVWSIGASFYTRSGSGIFTISVTCDPVQTEKVIQAIREEIDLFHVQPPTEAELKRAKKIIESEWIFDNETYHAQASNLGYFGILNQLSFMKKYIRNIKKVSSKDVERVMREYLKKNRMAVSRVVPR